MSVPEGYESVASIAEHTIKLAVPVIGRADPILITAPRKEWVPPNEVEKVREFLKPYEDAEQEIMAWHRAEMERENSSLPEDDRPQLPPYPDEAKKLLESVNMREITLRWLKPYMTAADYKLLTTSKNIPEKSIEDLSRRLESGVITQGESSASTDS